MKARRPRLMKSRFKGREVSYFRPARVYKAVTGEEFLVFSDGEVVFKRSSTPALKKLVNMFLTLARLANRSPDVFDLLDTFGFDWEKPTASEVRSWLAQGKQNQIKPRGKKPIGRFARVARTLFGRSKDA